MAQQGAWFHMRTERALPGSVILGHKFIVFLAFSLAAPVTGPAGGQGILQGKIAQANVAKMQQKFL